MPIKVLFVCLGNICRSPLAQGVFSQTAAERGFQDRFRTDSAGTGSWHVGDPPDPRSVSTAATHGINISDQRCRQIDRSDFFDFDYIFGMDQRNLNDLQNAAPTGHTAEIDMLLRFSGLGEVEIPDPYYGAEDGFESVYRTLKDASQTIIDRINEDQAANS